MTKPGAVLTVKHFSELSRDELFALYRLRVATFVVEQKCPYQEVDEADKSAYHLWLADADGIVAYARVLPAGVAGDDVAIGRVLAVKRRCGLGSRIVAAAGCGSGKKPAFGRKNNDRSAGVCPATV